MQDANYNVVALFGNSGSVVERYAYDPFGSVTVLNADFNLKSGGSDFAWLYLHQGGRFDSVSGLYHFRHRDYSPTLARWTSLDPIRYAAGDVNLYRALGNNPVNRVDPSGLDWLDWVQGGLDVVGVFDPTPLSDGTNALISLGRGDWTGAGLSAISMIPYAGDVIGKGGKAVRYGKKTVDAIEAAKPTAKQTGAPGSGGLFNTGPRAIEPASPQLIAAVQRKGRTITYALPGSDEARYLDFMRANANVGGPDLRHILLRPDPRKVEVLEEFLHGTQQRLGIIDRLGVQGAEIHVKEFMIRHQRLLGISDEDVRILQQMLGR